MPRIDLKPYSAEFAEDNDTETPERCCEMPGCRENGAHKAPKNRALSDHYRFCLQHVQEYNKAWDYFSGLSNTEVEDCIINSTLWDRPTWRYDTFSNLEEALYKKSWQTYHFSEDNPHQKQEQPVNRNTPEYEAMAIMALEPPLSLDGIKARYKELVKKHHPDVNRDNPHSEELLKSINMAYTILKMSYEKFERLPSQNP